MTPCRECLDVHLPSMTELLILDIPYTGWMIGQTRSFEELPFVEVWSYACDGILPWTRNVP